MGFSSGAEQKRTELMDAAIRVITEKGLENIAVNDICTASGINVAYVYRYFANKEDLIAKAFARVDKGLLDSILSGFTVLKFDSIDYEMRCRVLFTKCWEYLMERPQELIFYVRYYYSYSFRKYAYADHMERYVGLIEKMKTAFPESVDVQMVMQHILRTVLGQAEGQILSPKGTEEESGECCFSLVYSVVKNCVKQDKLKTKTKG